QETLNLWLAAGRGHWQLVAQDGALRLLHVTDYTGPDSVAAAIAAVLAGLLAEVPATEVRKCENPACVLWFRDTSKRGNRRWCSMAACGNRAKAAAHRRRLRAGDGGG
ncbi:MAG TPA: CGNR zinc finger domain-containing protein, partial [Plasticicumulans sp.]|nr:CGNR zinc finger domain-containing protein [Plasticicumulans sp.]